MFFTSRSKGGSYFELIQKQSKKTPGVGAYSTLGPKQKPLNILDFDRYKDKEGKVQKDASFVDDAIFKGQTVPAAYPPVKLDTIRRKGY